MSLGKAGVMGLVLLCLSRVLQTGVGEVGNLGMAGEYEVVIGVCLAIHSRPWW